MSVTIRTEFLPPLRRTGTHEHVIERAPPLNKDTQSTASCPPPYRVDLADWRENRRRLQVPGGRAQQAAVESRAVVADAERDVGVDVAGVDARGLQRVALHGQRLGAVCFRDAGVADQQVS